MRGDCLKYRLLPLEEGEAELIWDKLEGGDAASEGEREELCVIKASDGDEVIGGCVLDIDLMKTAEFNSLWVDERFRRQGVGSALIREAERIAAVRNGGL